MGRSARAGCDMHQRAFHPLTLNAHANCGHRPARLCTFPLCPRNRQIQKFRRLRLAAMAASFRSAVLLLLVAFGPRPASAGASVCLCDFGFETDENGLPDASRGLICRQAFGDVLLCFDYLTDTTNVGCSTASLKPLLRV